MNISSNLFLAQSARNNPEEQRDEGSPANCVLTAWRSFVALRSALVVAFTLTLLMSGCSAKKSGQFSMGGSGEEDPSPSFADIPISDSAGGSSETRRKKPPSEDEEQNAEETRPETRPSEELSRPLSREDEAPEKSKPRGKPAGLPTAVFLGLGILRPNVEFSAYTAPTKQYQMQLRHQVFARGSARLTVGLDGRYAKFAADLDPPRGLAISPSLTFDRVDTGLALGLGYSPFKYLELVGEVGPTLGYRRLLIISESQELSDDYFADTASGYLLRAAMEVPLKLTKKYQFVMRLFFGYYGGQKLKTGRLNYSHEELDINPRMMSYGVDLGCAL